MVAENNIKTESSLAQITFTVCKKERDILNIIHTCISNKLPCYTSDTL
jgi:hypothetical protein